jgi:hypothetical protein
LVENCRAFAAPVAAFSMLLLMVANQPERPRLHWQAPLDQSRRSVINLADAALAAYHYSYLNIGQNAPPVTPLEWPMPGHLPSLSAPLPAQTNLLRP